jgi:hypothetical protein
MSRRITAVIVGYNSEDFLDACLESVLKSTERAGQQVVLVDNASRNQTFPIRPVNPIPDAGLDPELRKPGVCSSLQSRDPRLSCAVLSAP